MKTVLYAIPVLISGTLCAMAKPAKSSWHARSPQVVRYSSILPVAHTLLKGTQTHEKLFGTKNGIYAIGSHGIVVPAKKQAIEIPSETISSPQWVIESAFAGHTLPVVFAPEKALIELGYLEKKTSEEQVEYFVDPKNFDRILDFCMARKKIATRTGVTLYSINAPFKKYITAELLNVIIAAPTSDDAERARRLLPFFATIDDSVAPLLSALLPEDRQLHLISCDLSHGETRDELIRDFAFFERANDAAVELPIKNIVYATNPEHVIELIDGAEKQPMIESWIHGNDTLN